MFWHFADTASQVCVVCRFHQIMSRIPVFKDDCFSSETGNGIEG